MLNLTLLRYAYLPTMTLGQLMLPGLKLYTMERPWIPSAAGPGGTPKESCVPDGAYRVTPHSSAKFPDTYQLASQSLGVYLQPGDIPAGQKYGRSAVLIHAGNYVADVIGCVAVGMTVRECDEGYMVSSSKAALDLLRAALRYSEAALTIRPSRGTNED